MERLRDLPNIGPEVECQLHEIGIDTKEQLINTGSTEAWLKIQQVDPSACIHRLMALEGAIQGIKKADLSQADKDHLSNFYKVHKKNI